MYLGVTGIFYYNYLFLKLKKSLRIFRKNTKIPHNKESPAWYTKKILTAFAEYKFFLYTLICKSCMQWYTDYPSERFHKNVRARKIQKNKETVDLPQWTNYKRVKTRSWEANDEIMARKTINKAVKYSESESSLPLNDKIHSAGPEMEEIFLTSCIGCSQIKLLDILENNKALFIVHPIVDVDF